jgi:hypothetical protein
MQRCLGLNSSLPAREVQLEAMRECAQFATPAAYQEGAGHAIEAEISLVQN